MAVSNILDKTMQKAKKVERLTKATKFSNVFKSIAQGHICEQDLKRTNNMVEIPVEDDYEYITENPKTVRIDIDFHRETENVLPFFRSIQTKLTEIYG